MSESSLPEESNFAQALEIESADELAGTTDPSDVHGSYRLACIYSLSIPAVEESRRPMPLTPEDKALQAKYRDKAVDALEQALRQGLRDYFNIKTDADLIPIRSDPRYQKILEKYGVK
jgi:hypothetical protein